MGEILVKSGIGIVIVTLLFSILPFSIGLPQEIVTFFTSGGFHDFIAIIYYFFPVDFLLICLLFLYSAKYLGVFMNIISWIYHKVMG